MVSDTLCRFPSTPIEQYLSYGRPYIKIWLSNNDWRKYHENYLTTGLYLYGRFRNLVKHYQVNMYCNLHYYTVFVLISTVHISCLEFKTYCTRTSTHEFYGVEGGGVTDTVITVIQYMDTYSM